MKWRLSHMVTDNTMEAQANALQICQLTSIQEFESLEQDFIW